jgi:hypothetical protein
MRPDEPADGLVEGGLDSYGPALGPLPKPFDRGLDEPVRFDDVELETRVRGHHARKLQKIFDPLRLKIGVALDRLHRLHALGTVRVFRAQDTRPGERGRQRRLEGA